MVTTLQILPTKYLAYYTKSEKKSKYLNSLHDGIAVFGSTCEEKLLQCF